MNALNIAEWSPDQVSQWMSGLGPKVAQYATQFLEKGVNGTKLLTLRCDDLEYLGMHVIGHQELLLEAVEHLRNFHYEISRECVQQLALRVSAAGGALARALRHADARLETSSLADVARTVHAVKPLVCWLDRWPVCSGAPLAERKAALLKLSLEAATCAQRDRFAEQPARNVAAAAAALAAVADYIIQEVSDPLILQPASVASVSLRQGGRPLGFQVLRSFCGHHQLAHIRFGSPAHASGHVHEGDEILQVGDTCVIGWSGAAVERACAHAGAELCVRLRRRGARALPALPSHAPAPRVYRRRHHLHPHMAPHRYELEFPLAARACPLSPPPASPSPEPEPAHAEPPPPSSSDESELSPPASPTQLLDRSRMYPPKPQTVTQRRHTISCGSPVSKRPHLTIEQFWQELQQHRWEHGDGPQHDDSTLYRRDKAVSCSTGLQLSPRPRTCLGVPRTIHIPTEPPQTRGKLDKSHSTPAYELEPSAPLAPLSDNPIPESPTTPKMDKQNPLRDIRKEKVLEDADTESNPNVDRQNPKEIKETVLEEVEDPTVPDLENSPDISEEDMVEVCQDMSEDIQELKDSLDDIKLIDDVSSDDTPLPVLETMNTVLIETDRPRIEDKTYEEDTPITKYPKPRITERWKVPEVPPEPPPRPNFRIPPPPPREYLPPKEPREYLPPKEPREHPALPPRETSIRENSNPFRENSNPFREIIREPSVMERDDRRYRDYDRERSREPLGSLSDLKILSPCREIHHVFERDTDSRSVCDGQTWEPLSMTPTASPVRECTAPQYPVLRMIPRPTENTSPLKPMRIGDASQISVSLRHITKHDIKLVSSERRELPPINGEPDRTEDSPARKRDGDIVISGCEQDAQSPKSAVSPTGSVVRGIFPSSKSRSLKKKNSMLAKRREVSAAAVSGGGAGGAGGWVTQRVRARRQPQPRWAHRYLLLAHNLLYAFRSPESVRAECMLYLEGCTVSAAGEVKSRAHAFKVYHTGRAFYFAAPSRDHMLLWIQLIHRATLLPSLAHSTDIKQFSETDYSETESDTENPDKRDRDRDKDKDKDKSKFGSLKKLTQRSRNERENDNASQSTSLDRKYLRFFSRNKTKDETKTKKQSVPVPTEHYRSYRRTPTPSGPCAPAPSAPCAPAPAPRSKPSPINYIHASNPNLLDFEKSDFVTKPAIQPKPKPKEKLVGLVTLEEFMLKKQEEERRQLYSERVSLGVSERAPHPPAAASTHAYETTAYPDERSDSNRPEIKTKEKVNPPTTNLPQSPAVTESGGASVSRLRLMFGGRQSESRPGREYPHLQCPPTFQPETYSLARLAPLAPAPRRP